MVALEKYFHNNDTKTQRRLRLEDGFGRYGKSPAASEPSVNSVAGNYPNGGVTGNIPNGTTDSLWQDWQTMEERNPFGGSGSTDTPIKQFIWGTYIDECLQINLLSVAGPQSLPVGAYYLLQDLLYRAVALTNSSGDIVEAYDTDAYGSTLIFTGPGADGIWFTDDDVQSDYGANSIIYCGYRFDPETENYYVRNRTYNPVLGRWIQRDPIGYAGGINLYGYVGSAPAGNLDIFGTICWPCVWVPFDMADVFLSATTAYLAGGAVIVSLMGNEEFDIALVPAFLAAVWKLKSVVQGSLADINACQGCNPCASNVKNMKADREKVNDTWDNVVKLIKKAKDLAEKAKKIINWMPEP